MKDWVPLYQNLLWIIFTVGVMVIYRSKTATIIDAIAKRIAAGSV